MSTNLAYALPLGSPRGEEHTRHIAIAPVVQRRARPKLAYALLAVGGIFAIFLAQLLLSIALSDGAYKISALTGTQGDLSRVEGALNEQLLLAGSTQNLASHAQKLGMVASSSPVFLRLSDGTVIGSATAAGVGPAAGASLVGNSLLTGATEDGTSFTGKASAAAKVTTPPKTGTPAAGAPQTDPLGAPLASKPGELPSPQTH
jgi:hypothetical protein